MFCHVCGKGVEQGDRFCNSCGASLEGVIDTPAVAAAAAGDADTETTGAPEPADETTGEAIVEADPTEATPATPEPATPPPSDTQQLPTEAIPSVERAADQSPEPAGDEPAPDPTGDWDIDPVWAPTGTVAAQAGVATGDLPSTEPITEVWMDTVAEGGSIDAPDAVGRATPYDFAEQEPVTRQTEVMQPTATAEMPAVAPPAADPHHFRFGAVTLFGIIGGIVTLVSLFANVLSVTSDTRLVPNDDTPFGFRTGEWIVDDLADNLSIAGLIAAVLMVAGGVAAAFGWRWGSGMAGGAGLGLHTRWPASRARSSSCSRSRATSGTGC
jgi:hypothetical protein